MSMSDDLFGDFRDDSILDHLDDEMESTRFPSLLSELNVLLRQELTRLGYDPRHSVELVAAICSRIGGMQLYSWSGICIYGEISKVITSLS
jgi:Mor family transcriptional regulator